MGSYCCASADDRKAESALLKAEQEAVNINEQSYRASSLSTNLSSNDTFSKGGLPLPGDLVSSMKEIKEDG